MSRRIGGIDSVADLGGMCLDAQLTLPIAELTVERPAAVDLVYDVDESGALMPFLEWKAEDAAWQPLETTAGECLRGFLALLTSDRTEFPGRVLAFARRVGVLGCCPHVYRLTAFDELKLTDGGVSRGNEREVRCTSCWEAECPREAVDSWGYFISHLQLLLMAQVGLAQDAGLPQELRTHLGPPWWGDDPRLLSFALLIRDAELGSRTLGDGGLTSTICFRRDADGTFRTTYSYTVRGLLSILWLEIGAVLASPDGVYLCSRCGSPFWIERTANEQRRRPWRNGQRGQYCSHECRQAARAQKERERYARAHPVAVRRSRHGRGMTSD